MSIGFFFFFSSRRRHTRCSRDWSSDVCSSDLSSKRAPPARGMSRNADAGDTRDTSRGLFLNVFRAADGVRLPIAGSGDFGTSPFLGNSSDKPVLASVWLDGGAGRKAQQ